MPRQKTKRGASAPNVPSDAKRLRSRQIQPRDDESRGDEPEILQLNEQTQPKSGNIPDISNFVDFAKVLSEAGIAPTNPQSQMLNQTTPPPSFSGGEEPIRLGGEDLSAHVPDKICKMIWAHEYININLLLKGSVELQEYCSGGVLHLTDKGQMETRPKVIKDKVMSIEKWTDAFLIFLSIYLKQHPNKVQEILQYMNIIREAASRSHSLAWRSYDEQFRVRQASNVQSWAKIHPDLWLRIMTSHTSSTEPHVSQRPLANCLDFNNGFCSFNPCRFKHACSNCGGLNHGRLSCFKLNSNAQAQTRGPPKFPQNRGAHSFPGGRGKPFNRRGRY